MEANLAMSNLDTLENKSIYIIREAFKKVPPEQIATLWSMGKDSTVLLWIIRKAFLGKVPFSVMHIDTGYKFPQMYEYRDRMSKEWTLDLKIAKNESALKKRMNKERGVISCCKALKTDALRKTVKKLGLKVLLLAIRRDEHGIRAKERYFSPRNEDFVWDYHHQPLEMWDRYEIADGKGLHTRVHPLLDWTELDIWRYIEAENIPVIDMYFAKGGSRYRSIGCASCTEPITSNAATISEIIRELEQTKDPERKGRAQDKENQGIMQKLRALGYM